MNGRFINIGYPVVETMQKENINIPQNLIFRLTAMIQLKEIFASLKKYDVKYLLCGGVAVNLYGIPRMTADIDVLIQWTETNIERFESALAEHKYRNNLFFQLKTLIPAETRLKYFTEKNLIAYSYSSDLLQAISLDVLVQTNINFDTCWTRKETKYIQEIPIYVLSVDDLMEMKQYANREQDRADIINLKKYYKK